MSGSPAANECPTAALISSNTPRYRLSDTKLSHVSGWCSNLSKRSFAVVSLHSSELLGFLAYTKDLAQSCHCAGLSFLMKTEVLGN